MSVGKAFMESFSQETIGAWPAELCLKSTAVSAISLYVPEYLDGRELKRALCASQNGEKC